GSVAQKREPEALAEFRCVIQADLHSTEARRTASRRGPRRTRRTSEVGSDAAREVVRAAGESVRQPLLHRHADRIHLGAHHVRGNYSAEYKLRLGHAGSAW